ncbi:MAG: hypothetical protein WBA44_09625 [Mesorhizobium sp.]
MEAEIEERRGGANVDIYPHLEGRKSRDVAAEKAGFGSDFTYRQAKSVVDNGTPELSPAQEAAHIRRRQEIWEIKNGPAKANSAKAANATMGRGDDVNANSAFTSDTAKSSGKSLRAVQVAAQRGRELKDDIHRIAGTSLDKGVEMDALIKLPEPERKSLIERASAISMKSFGRPLSTFTDRRIASRMSDRAL